MRVEALKSKNDLIKHIQTSSSILKRGCGKRSTSDTAEIRIKKRLSKENRFPVELLDPEILKLYPSNNLGHRNGN